VGAPLGKRMTTPYNDGMETKEDKITLRVRPDVRRALDKIIAFKSAEFIGFGQTDALNVAVLMYAKTLPDVPKVAVPVVDESKNA
jgi:hypothetical protein